MFEVRIDVTLGLSKGLSRQVDRLLDAIEPPDLSKLNRALAENEDATAALKDAVDENK